MERFHKYDANIPFPFLFHSIPFPNPFANIIGLSFFPFQFLSISTLLPFHFASTNFFINFPYHFLSICSLFPFYFSSPNFFINVPFHFHSNSIPFLLILLFLIFPYIFHYHSTLIPFCFSDRISIISKISSFFFCLLHSQFRYTII